MENTIVTVRASGGTRLLTASIGECGRPSGPVHVTVGISFFSPDGASQPSPGLSPGRMAQIHDGSQTGCDISGSNASAVSPLWGSIFWVHPTRGGTSLCPGLVCPRTFSAPESGKDLHSTQNPLRLQHIDFPLPVRLDLRDKSNLQHGEG